MPSQDGSGEVGDGDVQYSVSQTPDGCATSSLAPITRLRGLSGSSGAS